MAGSKTYCMLRGSGAPVDWPLQLGGLADEGVSMLSGLSRSPAKV